VVRVSGLGVGLWVRVATRVRVRPLTGSQGPSG
jgi:hypothetical protein